MNTLHTTTVSGQTLPLDPPRPPRKPHMLLWIDTETTGISRLTSDLLEIGMIITSMDGTDEISRFTEPVRPDHLSLYDTTLTALRMHLDNGLLDTVLSLDPLEYGYETTAHNLYEWVQDEAAQYTLHPAGTNVDYDIDLLEHQFEPYLHAGWLRELTSHRKLDLSTYRLAQTALGNDPYQGHAGTHRATDCISRDRNDYALYLDIQRAGHQA